MWKRSLGSPVLNCYTESSHLVQGNRCTCVKLVSIFSLLQARKQINKDIKLFFEFTLQTDLSYQFNFEVESSVV